MNDQSVSSHVEDNMGPIRSHCSKCFCEVLLASAEGAGTLSEFTREDMSWRIDRGRDRGNTNM